MVQIVSRRTLLLGLPVGLAALGGAWSWLASDRTPRPFTPPEGAATVAVADVPLGDANFMQDAPYVVVQPAPDEFRAFKKKCPHDYCFVNAVRNDAIWCPCHGSQFDLADGSVQRGPARRGLFPAVVTRHNDTLYITEPQTRTPEEVALDARHCQSPRACRVSLDG